MRLSGEGEGAAVFAAMRYHADRNTDTKRKPLGAKEILKLTEVVDVMLNRKHIPGKSNDEKEDGRAERIAVMYIGYRAGAEKNMR